MNTIFLSYSRENHSRELALWILGNLSNESANEQLRKELAELRLSVSAVVRELPDEVLAIAVQKRIFRADAFEELFANRYMPVIFPRWFARWGARPTQAEDIAQDLAMKFWVNGFAAYLPVKPLSGYLYRAARNCWVDRVRKEHPTRPFKPRELPASPEPGPEEVATAQDQLDRLHWAIARLPHGQQQVMESLLLGKTFAEMEVCLGLRLDELYRLNFVARRNLERILSRQGQAD